MPLATRPYYMLLLFHNACFHVAEKVCSWYISNNIVFVYKSNYINCFRLEIGLNTLEENLIYTCTKLSKEEILRTHKMVLLFFGIFKADEDLGEGWSTAN